MRSDSHTSVPAVVCRWVLLQCKGQPPQQNPNMSLEKILGVHSVCPSAMQRLPGSGWVCVLRSGQVHMILRFDCLAQFSKHAGGGGGGGGGGRGDRSTFAVRGCAFPFRSRFHIFRTTMCVPLPVPLPLRRRSGVRGCETYHSTSGVSCGMASGRSAPPPPAEQPPCVAVSEVTAGPGLCKAQTVMRVWGCKSPRRCGVMFCGMAHSPGSRKAAVRAGRGRHPLRCGIPCVSPPGPPTNLSATGPQGPAHDVLRHAAMGSWCILRQRGCTARLQRRACHASEATDARDCLRTGSVTARDPERPQCARAAWAAPSPMQRTSPPFPPPKPLSSMCHCRDQ